ncbi:MAG TPA: EAL domain-containing protein, partial [Rhodocyclaceae bacterium]|nr:EAL domain-containing protein [Rhodocyclaceae bacterium]
VAMLHALRTAFEDQRLFLVYHPQVDLTSGRAVGAEALLRWRTDDGSYVSPDRFIPLAEYSGLIITLGEWVLRSACRELVRLAGLGMDNFRMAVNVSVSQFRDPGFLRGLRRALADSGANPANLELEITESVAMEDADFMMQTLSEIKLLGCSISIDDFGTGYSSLSHLQRLCIDRLKIDKAFIDEITQSERGSRIAEMVVQLGRNLGLSVIAEGVENEQQASVLRVLGCHEAQGFLFAKPMPADQHLAWLQEQLKH